MMALAAVLAVGAAACSNPQNAQGADEYGADVAADAPPGADGATPPGTEVRTAESVGPLAGSFVGQTPQDEGRLGGVTFNGPNLEFALGHVYTTEMMRQVEPDMRLTTDGRTVSQVLANDALVGGELRRVSEELVNARAAGGGLCSPQAANFIVIGRQPDGAIALAGLTGTAAPDGALNARPCAVINLRPADR
jgi:hypothetical protein